MPPGPAGDDRLNQHFGHAFRPADAPARRQDWSDEPQRDLAQVLGQPALGPRSAEKARPGDRQRGEADFPEVALDLPLGAQIV